MVNSPDFQSGIRRFEPGRCDQMALSSNGQENGLSNREFGFNPQKCHQNTIKNKYDKLADTFLLNKCIILIGRCVICKI